MYECHLIQVLKVKAFAIQKTTRIQQKTIKKFNDL